jgi:quercetin dioxygenase-like cupin family protein
MSETSNRTMFDPIWATIKDIEPFSPVPDVEMRVVSSDKLMLNFVRIAPGGVVPTHHHHHEQGGTVLEGVLILTIAGETRHVRPGDAYLIPGGVQHSATTDGGGCLVLDVFAPPREDYLPKNR